MFLDTAFLHNEEVTLRLDRTVEEDPARGWAPAYQFTICRTGSDEEMGLCDLRLGHSVSLYYGGNIGYRVYPPYRGHHYAAKACRLLFELARRHGMGYLLITCNPDNLPSRRTLEGLGGELEALVDLPVDNDMYREGERQKCVFRYKL